MKLAELGLRTYIVKTDNLYEAKAWYARVFDTEPYFDEPFYVGFNIAGYELGLMPDKMPAADKTDNVLTYWGVENVEEEYERLLSLGATKLGEPTNVGGEIVVAEVKDPWGNAMGIIYNPDFKLP